MEMTWSTPYRIINGIIFAVLVFLMQSAASAETEFDKATFAGGCFWCMEPPYEKLKGVKEVITGYTGGHKKDPTYKDVSSGTTGHAEAIQVVYATSEITYEELLNVFWRQINPTDPDGQFVDRGSQYRTAIYYHNKEQMSLAEKSKEDLMKSGRYNKPIVTEILPAVHFYRAEQYHQDYYINHSIRYKLYRFGSGRDKYLDEIWNDNDKKGNLDKDSTRYQKPPKEELTKSLSPLQYRVTQEDATEKAFDNEFWNNKKEGIYVDIVSGEPLFSSHDKFDSGTGWPSFTKAIDAENIIERDDRSLFIERTEVRSSIADSHLGHVFNDGPSPTGRRYCINSASLRFIPKEDLEKEGYNSYRILFNK